MKPIIEWSKPDAERLGMAIIVASCIFSLTMIAVVIKFVM